MSVHFGPPLSLPSGFATHVSTGFAYSNSLMNWSSPDTSSPMHARELVELAAVVAAHGPALVTATKRISQTGLECYWAANKCRLDRWARALQRIGRAPTQSTHDLAVPAPQAPSPGPLLEEILCSEVLSRVWTAVLCAYDQARSGREAEPIARNCLLGHLELRHRALNLLLRTTVLPHAEAVAVNRLRRRTERWTDLLIANVCRVGDVSDLAPRPDRCLEFADDFEYQRRTRNSDDAWHLSLASLRSAFGAGLAAESPNADLNGRIASCILACFQQELFDGTGSLRSLWIVRMMHNTSDAEGMLEELLAEEENPPSGRFNAKRRFA